VSLPRYKCLKDSGLEWLGEVPEHWTMTSVGRVTLEKCDGPFGSDLKSEHYVEAGVRVIRLQNIRQGAFDDSDAAFIDEAYFRASLVRHGVRRGDLLIAGLGDDRNTVGRACVAPTDIEPAIVKADCFRFRLESSKALPEFVAAQLTAGSAIDAGLFSSGSTRSRIPLSTMASRKLVLPPLSEQKAIAAFLDRETAKSDELVAEQRRLIDLLEEKRQAVIAHAVTKGLNPNAPMKPSGVECLGDVPGHWDIGGLTRFIGPVVDYRGRTPTKIDAGMFLVTAKNIRNGRIDYLASEEYVDPASAESLLNRGRPELGDLLFTMEAPLGQVALIDRTDIALAQRIVKFRGRPGVLDNRFLLFWLMSEPCQAKLITLATGSTALGIKASKLGMIDCPVPPVDEQMEIVAEILKNTAKLDELTNEARQAINLLKERRSALISAAVTGQIDVRGLVQQEAA
jgi:type I restriction enzyme, S subunit